MNKETSFTVDAYFAQLSKVAALIKQESVERAIDLIKKAWDDGRKVITLGNGGSAQTASHYVTDWNKAPFLSTGKRFLGICLSDNVGLVTAYGNDISYDDIFSEQLKNVMDSGDVVIAVSGSGNSPNVIKAIEHANAEGGKTLAICGYDGGRIREIAQQSVWIPSYDMQICEDLHLVFGHLVMKALCGSSIRID